MKRNLAGAMVAGYFAVTAVARGGEVHRLQGSYVRGAKGGAGQPLSAVFTPVAGKVGEWSVVFTALFKGKNGTYTGAATGDPAGEIKGAVANQGGKRTWRFEAATAAGALNGRHWETTGGKEKSTGSFTLQPGA